jgi:hypothetical protein
MKGAAVRRSRDQIVDDIINDLVPLRWDAGDPRAGIMGALELVQKVTERDGKTSASAVIRKRASRLMNALSDMQAALQGEKIHLSKGDKPSTGFEEMWIKIEPLAHTPSRDPRSSILQRMGAHQALALVKQFSKRKPTTALGGNVQCIAQLLFEAITGKQCSGAELLKAVQKMHRWDKPISP